MYTNVYMHTFLYSITKHYIAIYSHSIHMISHVRISSPIYSSVFSLQIVIGSFYAYKIPITHYYPIIIWCP